MTVIVSVQVPQPGTMVQHVFELQAFHATQVRVAAGCAGTELHRARLALGWSLRDAAREAGLPNHTQVRRMEGGEWRPRYARKLADTYARALKRRHSSTLTILSNEFLREHEHDRPDACK